MSRTRITEQDGVIFTGGFSYETILVLQEAMVKATLSRKSDDLLSLR